jgi:phosphate transport system protein
MAPMRTIYHEALEGTRLDVVRLGALVAEAISVAAQALEQRNAAAGAKVVAGDDVIDDLRRNIESHCIELIWRQQPVAGELREIAAMLNIVTDLERIGDYAVELAKNAIKLADMPLRPKRVEIDRIVGVVHGMLLDAMRAYSERDDALATSVIEHDREVDQLYKRSISILQEEMQADPEVVPAATRYLFILTSLERAGDRAGNVAWHTKDMLGLG